MLSALLAVVMVCTRSRLVWYWTEFRCVHQISVLCNQQATDPRDVGTGPFRVSGHSVFGIFQVFQVVEGPDVGYLVQIADFAVVPAGKFYPVTLPNWDGHFFRRRHVGWNGAGFESISAEVKNHLVLLVELWSAVRRDVDNHWIDGREGR